MPLRGTSRPLGGRDDPRETSSLLEGRDAASGVSSRIRKVFFYEETLGRGLGNIFLPPARWMGGRSPAPRLPPVDWTGGTHFSNFSKPAPLFRIYFFNPFFKKTLLLCALSRDGLIGPWRSILISDGLCWAVRHRCLLAHGGYIGPPLNSDPYIAFFQKKRYSEMS
jgi:hypothetical protein